MGGCEFLVQSSKIKVQGSQHEAMERWQRRPAAVLSRSRGGTPLPLWRQKDGGKNIRAGGGRGMMDGRLCFDLDGSFFILLYSLVLTCTGLFYLQLE
jgi:hypothetical protein